MNTGSNLGSLPILDTPDKIVAHAYAALIGELLHITINTVSQLKYSMSSLTRYTSKAKLIHLTYVKWCCVILLASRKDNSEARGNGSENRFLSRVRSTAKRECEP